MTDVSDGSDAELATDQVPAVTTKTNTGYDHLARFVGLCPYCDEPLYEAEESYDVGGETLGVYRMLRCSECDNRFHPAETCRRIERDAKDAGLWGRERE